MFSGGRLAASDDETRPLTYRLTLLPSAVTATCCQAGPGLAGLAALAVDLDEGHALIDTDQQRIAGVAAGIDQLLARGLVARTQALT